jgi:hypothetical protein
MFSSSVSSDNPEFIYFDYTMCSNRTEDTGTDPTVRFTESRTQSIIDDCSQYNLSIVRFTMDGCGGDLPMWIPQIMPLAQQQALQGFTAYDPNLTIYGITISGSREQSNGYITEYLEWTPEVSGAVVGAPNYYYCNSYSHFCDMFNTAAASAFSQVAFQMQDTTTKPPQLVYNGSTNLFSLYCDNSSFGPDKVGDAAEYEIVFDTNLYGLLRNFNSLYTPNSQPLTYEIIIRNRLNNIFTVNGTSYYVVTQDFPSTDSIWSPVQSIVFTTSLLPIIPEQIGSPIIVSNGGGSNAYSSVANFQSTITDIALPLIRSSDYKGFVEYAPNPYRMIPLSDARREVRDIDVAVWWKDRDGNLNPITMSNGATVSLKLLFRSKGLGV